MSNEAGSSRQGLPSFQNKMEELLQCPICMHFMFPPIFQCTNGHPVCAECKERITTNSCPICREDLGTIRCLVLPQMATSLEFPCRFSSSGCEDIIPYETKSNHEKNLCRFRPYSCPLSIEDHCAVMGDIPHLFSHMQRDHMVDVHYGLSFRLMYRQLNLPRHSIVINCFGKQFCLHFDTFKNVASTTFFSASLRIMGEIEEAAQFGYSLEIKGSWRKLSSEGLIGSIRENTRMVIPVDGDGIIIPLKSPLFVLEVYHNFDLLEIKGKIKKIY